MKRFLALTLVFILMTSIFGVMTATASSASVSFGTTKPEAGKTITYKVSVTATASSIAVKSITCSGVFSGSSTTAWKDSSTGTNQKITATGSIKVKVSSNAKPGATGTIKVSYEVSTFDGTKVGSYSGSQSKSYTVVKPAAATPKPTTTKTTSKTSSTTAASVKPGEWETAELKIAAAQQGASINAVITKDALIPVSLLSAIKEKQCIFTANFDKYSCTIDGSKLATVAKSGKIDLSLKTDKDTALSKAVNSQDVYQLHFKDQQLPGKFDFTFKADKSKPGDILYLYYYYSGPGVIEGIESATVGQDGMTTFSIYHCSSYIVTASPISGAAGVDFSTVVQAAAVPSAAPPTQQPDNMLSELESQLKTAKDDAASVKTQLDTAKTELNSAKSDLDAAKALSTESISVPAVALITALCGAAVLAVFLTMLFGRIGVFKKKNKNDSREHRFGA